MLVNKLLSTMPISVGSSDDKLVAQKDDDSNNRGTLFSHCSKRYLGRSKLNMTTNFWDIIHWIGLAQIQLFGEVVTIVGTSKKVFSNDVQFFFGRPIFFCTPKKIF